MSCKVHVWHTGYVYCDRAIFVEEKTWHPMAFTGWLRPKSKKVQAPISCYLIEHPKGRVIVDTGWHEDVRISQLKHLGWMTSSTMKITLPEGESIAERLQAAGIEYNEIDFVVLSHFHSDHVSGLKHVSGAKQILTSEPEWEAANKKPPGYVPTLWEGVPIQTFKFQEIPFGPLNLGYDLFGDGLIYIVFTPGHSKGLCSVLVQTSKGWVVLISDVGHSKQSWEGGVLPGLYVNKDEARKSLNWVNEFAKRDDCYQVIANHDPSIEQQIIE